MRKLVIIGIVALLFSAPAFAGEFFARGGDCT